MCSRIQKLIDPNKVAIGGEIDAESLFIAPTVMTNVTGDDLVMQEEVNDCSCLSVCLSVQYIYFQHESYYNHKEINYLSHREPIKSSHT